MYDLTCPSCGRTTRWPFLRQGAVTTCQKCQTRYRIGSEHVAHRSPDEPPTGVENPLVVDAPEAAGSSRLDEARPESLMHSPDVPEAPAVTLESSPDPPPPSSAKLKMNQRKLARAVKRRNRTPVLLAVGAIVLIVICLGVVIVSLSNRQAPAQGGSGITPPAQAGTDNSPPPETSPTPTMPTGFAAIEATPLHARGWQSVNDPSPPHFSGPLQIENEQVLPAPAGGIFYSIDVNASSFDAFRSAQVRFHLIDERQRVFARNTTTLALLSGNRKQRVTVFVPRHLYEAMDTIRATTEPGPRMSNSVFLDKVEITTEGETPLVNLKVRAQNPSSQPLEEVLLVVEALNEKSQPVGRWRIDWPEPIAPQSTIALRTPLQLPSNALIMEWVVSGAGRPAQ